VPSLCCCFAFPLLPPGNLFSWKDTGNKTSVRTALCVVSGYKEWALSLVGTYSLTENSSFLLLDLWRFPLRGLGTLCNILFPLLFSDFGRGVPPYRDSQHLAFFFPRGNGNLPPIPLSLPPAAYWPSTFKVPSVIYYLPPFYFFGGGRLSFLWLLSSLLRQLIVAEDGDVLGYEIFTRAKTRPVGQFVSVFFGSPSTPLF